MSFKRQKQPAPHLQRRIFSIDFAYAVIRLIQITVHNKKALTVRRTAWKFLHGPKQILPGPGPCWPVFGYATGYM